MVTFLSGSGERSTLSGLYNGTTILFPINRAWLRERKRLDRRSRGGLRSASNWLFSGWRRSQRTGSLRFFKLLTQNEATFVTKADLWVAMIIILRDVEDMLADTAGEPLNRTTIAIRDERGNVHIILALFIELLLHWEKRQNNSNQSQSRCIVVYLTWKKQMLHEHLFIPSGGDTG